MGNAGVHVCVCICTFKRPHFLKRLLEELTKQETRGQFTYSIIVVDNDQAQSAKAVVIEFANRSSIRVDYCVQPQRNIAMARNTAVANASGNFVAFIDDDEFPVTGWLLSLLNTCTASGADGVLGPVKPFFEEEPPLWAVRGGFFERPSHDTGYRIGQEDARTGNVLLKKTVFGGATEPFRVEFRTGGEDADFFRRMMGKGCVFLWCNEAVAYEVVPASRCRRGYLLRRALLRGRISLNHGEGTALMVVKSCIAVPAYALALPFLLLVGEHRFMKCLIKLCDHLGRLLACARLNPVREREM